VASMVGNLNNAAESNSQLNNDVDNAAESNSPLNIAKPGPKGKVCYIYFF